MDDKLYVDERLQDQINWYGKKSETNQGWYRALRIAELIFAAAIPLMVSQITVSTLSLKVFVAALGVLIVILTGLISLFRFQELWIEYRSTCETLKHEKYLYLTRSGPYGIDDPFHLLVNRVESLLSKEHSVWAQYIRKKEGKDG